MKIDKKITILFCVFFIFFLFSKTQIVYSAKGFIVEKESSGKVLITDGTSQYIIEHSYECYDSDFYEGATIYIDTYYSPNYGDKIITSGYSQNICEVTSSDDVNIKKFFVNKVFDSDDKILVTDENNMQVLVEYGIGCSLSMWRYEDKMVDIDIGGSFLDGIGDTIYLFDSNRNCKVWDGEELNTNSRYAPPPNYTPPVSTTYTCPENSSYRNGQCICNTGYKADGLVCVKVISCSDGYTLDKSGSKCVTYTQSCQELNYNDQNIIGFKEKNGEIKCTCLYGHSWNGNQCIKDIIKVDRVEPEIKKTIDTKKVEEKVDKDSKIENLGVKPDYLESSEDEKNITNNISTTSISKEKAKEPNFFKRFWKFIWRF